MHPTDATTPICSEIEVLRCSNLPQSNLEITYGVKRENWLNLLNFTNGRVLIFSEEGWVDCLPQTPSNLTSLDKIILKEYKVDFGKVWTTYHHDNQRQWIVQVQILVWPINSEAFDFGNSSKGSSYSIRFIDSKSRKVLWWIHYGLNPIFDLLVPC